MDKKILVAGIIILALILGFVIFRPSTGTGATITSHTVNDLTLTEKEKYAMFSAEVACELAKVMQEIDEEDMENFIQETVRISEELANKYGYSMSEATSKQMEYAEDKEFQAMARDYTLNICPEIASELEIDT